MIARRLPLRVRPVFFALAWPLIAFGLALGLNLDWDVSLFTGNVLLQIAAGASLFPDSPAGLGSLLLALVGLAFLAWSSTAPRGLAVFYPLAMLLGLFVSVFGATYLFDVTMSGENTGVGGVLFVFFDYANLFHRPFQSGFGLLMLVIGLVILGGASFGRRPAGPARKDSDEAFQPVVRGADPPTPRPAARVEQNRAVRRASAASARPRH